MKIFTFLLTFGIVSISFSQIITSSINDTIVGVGNISVDVNQDNSDDYRFEIIMLPIGDYAARVVTLNSSRFLDNSTFGYADALIFGDPVQGNFNNGMVF